jgi:hypothetical protein
MASRSSSETADGAAAALEEGARDTLAGDGVLSPHAELAATRSKHAARERSIPFVLLGIAVGGAG